MSQAMRKLLLFTVYMLYISRSSRAILVETAPSILLPGQCANNKQNEDSVSVNISSILRDKVVPALSCPDLGSCVSNPGVSCKQIAEERPDAPSGDYWIRLCNDSAVQVFCDMNSRCCNSSSGWMRAAFVNMTDSSHKCPAGLYFSSSDPKRVCRRKVGYGCKSIFFPVYYLPYTRVCGRVTAYQVGSADAFWQYYRDNTTTLDDDFLDGVTITVGYPRTHIWSFAAANSEGGAGADSIFSCPCARTDIKTNGVVPPFVKNEYFCESGTANGWAPISDTFYPDDPLWDGENCPPNSACCQINNPPWFCRDLGAELRNDFEVRLCGDEEFANEDIALELVELYIQ